MFKRKPKQEVISAPPSREVAAAPTESQVMQRMLGEFMASTALSRVQSDIGQIAADFRQFKDNIAALNSELGVFREKVIIPVKEELQYIRYNLGARSDDTVGSLQKLVHHLEAQLELLLKARGVNPQQIDADGETPLDKMGVSPNRPDYQELELHRQIEEQRQALERMRDERTSLKLRLAQAEAEFLSLRTARSTYRVYWTDGEGNHCPVLIVKFTHEPTIVNIEIERPW